MTRKRSAAEKRLRRRVIGREQDFFAVVTPGFEAVCRDELLRLGVPDAVVTANTGGVHFAGKLPLLYAANLHLRTASRILMRVGAIKATSFSQLTARAASIDWDLYLRPAQPVSIHVTTRHCRLYHKGAVSERVKAAVENTLGAAAPDGGGSRDVAPQRLFVRGVADRFMISLDSSGELLHKRGIKQQVGPAPIRETMAAAALVMAGHTPGSPLVDPMCGSGTFSLEAAMMAAGIPPGWYRRFAFMDWPGFRQAAWDHMRKQALVPESGSGVSRNVFASDIRSEAVAALRQAAAQMGVERQVGLFVGDFFAVDGRRVPGGPGTVVLNPPYGLRMGQSQKPRDAYRRISAHLVQAFSGWRAAVFCPAARVGLFKPLGLRQTHLPHGGLRLALLTGRIGGDSH
jgi:putative N6-adenine-specific DNA methylase